MSSRAQRRANQRNAQLSTGPKTPEGKLVQAHRALCARCARFDSSRNNLRHGLAGRLIVASLSPSEAADFHELALSLHAEHAPQTPTETLLVDRMAESFYMSSRAIALQSAALLSGDDKRLSLLLRYQTTHERAFFKSLSELTKLRKEKRQQQIGFEPQQQNQELYNSVLASLAACAPNQKRTARGVPPVRNSKFKAECDAEIDAPAPDADYRPGCSAHDALARVEAERAADRKARLRPTAE